MKIIMEPWRLTLKPWRQILELWRLTLESRRLTMERRIRRIYNFFVFSTTTGGASLKVCPLFVG
jgi:hypothetical protein